MSNPNDPGYRMAKMREKLKAILEQQGVDVEALDRGSSHAYACQCETCWRWWQTMGLGDEPNPPFTQEMLDAATYEEVLAIANREM